MGVETYEKNGQVSKKPHGGKGQQVKEHYKEYMYEPNPAMGSGPDSFERRYMNNYRKGK